jgi:hypothetical protein
MFSLLFAGLLMNYDRVPNGLKWMQTLSFFHAGYEALLVNELRYLQLIEHKVSYPAIVTLAKLTSSSVLISKFPAPRVSYEPPLLVNQS